MVENGLDLIVRVTCDCPMINGILIDHMLSEYLNNGYKGFMGCNNLISPAPYPDGVDCEIFSWNMLAESHWKATRAEEREHVAPYMYRQDTQYKIYSFFNRRPNPIISAKIQDFSFDTLDDFHLLQKLTYEYDQNINPIQKSRPIC